jgi:SAM-dependent methyltransferase
VKLTVAERQRTVHLGAADVYPALERCPICLAEGSRPAVLCLQRSPTIQMLHCERCRASSADYMPLPSVLDAYYANYWNADHHVIAHQNAGRFAAHLWKHVPLSVNGELRILDFGGGDGIVARRLGERIRREHQTDVAIDVVDVIDEDCGSDNHIRVRKYKSLEDVAGNYDLVLASAVLEHIPDAHSILRRLLSLGRPGGAFYARTPYALPFARLVPNFEFTYPGHVHDMGGRFWGRVTEIFNVDARILRSAPSPVEIAFATNPIRAAAATLLKLPGFFESSLRSPASKDRFWNLVGGWEIVLRFLG